MQFLSEEMIYQKTSQELTALLYEACLDNLESAISHINQKQFIEANKKLQNANDILQRLGVGLKYEAGIVADQLDALYNYMADRVIEANLTKNIDTINEVISVLTTITSSWNEALKKKEHAAKLGLRKKAAAYEQHVMISPE